MNKILVITLSLATLLSCVSCSGQNDTTPSESPTVASTATESVTLATTEATEDEPVDNYNTAVEVLMDKDGTTLTVINKNRDPLRIVGYDLYGSLAYIHEYTYDENGVNTLIKMYGEGKEYTGYIKTEYFENGSVAKESTYYPDDTLSELKEYNADGDITLEEHYDLSGGIRYKETNAYNDKGNLAERLIYLVENDVFGLDLKQLYEYSEDGTTSKMTQYDRKGEVSITETREYDSKGNCIKTVLESNNSPSTITEYKYNEKGLLTSSREYDLYEHDSLFEYIEYEYNDDGFLTSQTEYDDKNEVHYRYLYTYSDDNKLLSVDTYSVYYRYYSELDPESGTVSLKNYNDDDIVSDVTILDAMNETVN